MSGMNGPRWHFERAPVWHYEDETQPDGTILRRPVLDAESQAELDRIMAKQATDSLDAAWAEAEAALREGWHFEVESGAFDASGLYRASAHWVDFYGGEPPRSESGDWQATPAAALRALAAKLREVGR